MRLVYTLQMLLAILTQTKLISAQGQPDFACYSLPRDNYTCAACIEYHHLCAWCIDKDFDDVKHSRCDSPKRLLTNRCRPTDVENPATATNVTQNDDLTGAGSTNDERTATQVKPQEIHVRIRARDTVTIPITYRQAIDYPVDLYYLMDLSRSMTDHRERLAQLGDLLAKKMKDITKNFQLGFGSFIDNNVIPFQDPIPEFWCTGNNCTPYVFRNEMPLSTNTALFSSRVRAAKLGRNLDAPEAGLDAIIQALSCTTQIGWRSRSRRMIVYSSDARFHYAGDGKLAGIVQPNDGECHLDTEETYNTSYAHNHDYVSLALLHQRIVRENANIIFAISKGELWRYKRLLEALPDVRGSASELTNKSDEVIGLIANAYGSISERVIMLDDVNPTSGLTLTYRSKCKGDVENNTNMCDGIKTGDQVVFDVTIGAPSCDGQKEFTIKISPSGLSEVVTLRVGLICDCPCQKTGLPSRSDAQCNDAGAKVCGVCACDDGFYGRKCQCVSGDYNASSTDLTEANCKRTNESVVCEGRGICDCGQCICNKRLTASDKIWGEFCECDNFNCPRFDRKLCAGHGRCDCHQCICDDGWEGAECRCPLGQDSCLAANGEVCSGRGECECGVCQCFEDRAGQRYSGPTCEVCPTCETKCVEYRPCVRCQMWKTGPYNGTRCDQCPFEVISVGELPEKNVNRTQVDCQFVDLDDDCTFYFLYDYDDANENVTVWVKRNKDCPRPVPLIPILIGVMAGVVLIGVLLLAAWKLLTVLHDRRELAKFERDRLLASWDTANNPIFLPATTSFKNPAFDVNDSPTGAVLPSL